MKHPPGQGRYLARRELEDRTYLHCDRSAKPPPILALNESLNANCPSGVSGPVRDKSNPGNSNLSHKSMQVERDASFRDYRVYVRTWFWSM